MIQLGRSRRRMASGAEVPVERSDSHWSGWPEVTAVGLGTNEFNAARKVVDKGRGAAKALKSKIR
jgi:hypothetical protein